MNATATLPGQLTVYDELDRREEGNLRRIGKDRVIGDLILRPLLLDGWRLFEFPAFAGQGSTFVLERGGVEVRRTADTLAEVAVELFEEAVSMRSIWAGE